MPQALALAVFLVTATNGAGSATATSAPTGVVAAAPSAPATGLGTALPSRLPESSGTQTLVVSPSGSATSSCALSTPCSFDRAWSLATSGTVIQLRGNAGSYSGNLFISGKSYSSSNPVTMRTYPGDPIATFVGGSTSPEWALHVEGDQGIRFRNFKVAAPKEGGLHIEESWHVELDGLIVRDNGASCPSTASYTTCGGTGILVSGGNTGFFTSYSDDVQIWNSTFVNNGGNSTYASIGCCNSSTNHDHAMYLGGGQSSTSENGFRSMVVANNLIYDSKDGYPVQIGQSARNLIFTNNTIDNTSNPDAACAIVVWGSGPWADSGDVFVNNIISNVAGSGSNAICASLSNSLSNNHVRNNLAYGVSGTTYDPAYGSMIGFDCMTSCPGQNLPNANPLYVDTSGTYGLLSKDFHLQAGSPALGKGDPAYTPPFDKDRNPRPAAPALGAFG
jgi:hypothetical protein